DTIKPEDRDTTALLVEQETCPWNSAHQVYETESFEQQMERKPQPALNPAYEPRYSEEAGRKTAGQLARIKSWTFWGGHDERPVRDCKVLGFWTNLEELRINDSEIADISILAGLPRLRSLHLASRKCEDFRPLAGCRQLRELH